MGFSLSCFNPIWVRSRSSSRVKNDDTNVGVSKGCRDQETSMEDPDMGFSLCCLSPIWGRRRSRSRVENHDNDVEDISKGGDGDEVKRYNWEEIQRLTMNFKEVIGVGGYSTVYLARLPGSTKLGAVKVYKYSERLSQVFKCELEICEQLHHDNIVKLLGYCDEREEGVLMFEYVPNGTLQEKLHNHEPNQGVLPWKARMTIAFQLIQALEYLHENHTLHIVHGDIKSSNILLDEDLNCMLCDFGFSKMGFSSTVQPHSSSSRSAMMGSPGYIDPHYLMTGIDSKKSDIYSFGVILLELIMGMEAMCSGRLLTSIVQGKNGFDINNVVKKIDRQLDGKLDIKEAQVMAFIATKCLHHSPSLRPSTSEIYLTMREKISSISHLLHNDKYKESWSRVISSEASSDFKRF